MKWFLILILFSSCSSTIEIYMEPLGEMDKPLPKIHLISNDIFQTIAPKESFSYGYSFQVDQKELMNMHHSIRKNLKLKSFDEDAMYSYGSYKISVIKDGVITDYLSSSNCITFELIDELKVISSEQELIDCFENLIMRLGCLKN